MHRLAIVLVAACGAPPPPAAPAPPRKVVEAPQPVGASARILLRLPVRDGKMPGLPFAVTSSPEKSYCGGVAVAVAPIARLPDDAALPRDVDIPGLVTLAMPALDDLGDGREAGLRAADRLAEWTQGALRDFSDVQFTLRMQMSKSTRFDDEIAALALIVEIERRFAAVFARAPIPAPFADEPARTGWCDSLADKVEGLVESAERDAEACRGAIERKHSTGWWTAACAP